MFGHKLSIIIHKNDKFGLTLTMLKFSAISVFIIVQKHIKQKKNVSGPALLYTSEC